MLIICFLGKYMYVLLKKKLILKDSISKLSALSSNQSKTNSLSFPRS